MPSTPETHGWNPFRSGIIGQSGMTSLVRDICTEKKSMWVKEFTED
jgi:hypothetical protein